MKTRIIFSSLKLFVWVSLLLYSSISFPQFKPGGLGGDNINIICGTDQRETSYNAAVGRILGIDINDRVVFTGTAFVLSNGMLVSAGHVKTEAEKVYAVRFEVEFNVKPSSTTGDLERSEPTDIYEVNLIEDYWFGIKAGRDYWIFEVYRNQITGLLPSDIASLEFVTNFSSTDFGTNAKMEVVGFGTAAGAKNLTQQSAIDDFYNMYQGRDPEDYEHWSQIVYKTDTAPGCSGGPVIVSQGDDFVGKVVGIHTNSYSDGTSGGIPCTNYGTAFNQETLADILNNVVHNKYKKVAVQSQLKRWWDGEFKPYSLDTEMEPTHLDLFFRYGDNETFQADKNVANGLKFHKWEETNNYQNHFTFSINANLSLVEALKDVPFGNITLRNSLIESDAIEFGSIYFKDPWLTKNGQDYNDPPYGYRNLGSTAIFEQVASPLEPSLSSIYKGVFKDLYPDIPNQLFYSVRVPQNFSALLTHTGKTHTFYFRGWSTVNAELNDVEGQNPPYGFEQKAVIFNNNNALVKANYKGTQLTDHNETYSNNNQRRVIKTPDGRMHSIYESNGSIFYEISYNNGDNWLLNDEINVKNQNPSWDIFDPVIDYYVNGALTHILIGFVLQREDPDGDWLRTYHY